jgi:hypothetical protein
VLSGNFIAKSGKKTCKIDTLTGMSSVVDEDGGALVEKSGWVQEAMVQQCAEGNNVVEITAHTEQEAGMLRKIHS